ncbi:hypothetical protein Dtox_3481 [Desulfofarcimen acetoxidans DSM 771]|uniref:Type I phosphodiesterase/nucleotide pyrophosphatase n=1 Tax=Desulfofarcimen acetoxidans (strain ATCC 49208 / DSM 771 / KCTC 5769 / VKM B-1644 / 5575) TaxID=485916 RepID=C8W6U1_DESAS|nr:alkaline phosphatase family protein [Desulfofarcimen acetoxidans]ACV64200.1 hypothetical protein Dtox_3481 [Desulfofarcimen acetoxidans DSM 771]
MGLLLLVIGAAALSFIYKAPCYIPPLRIIGDVSNSYCLQSPNEIGKLEQISFQGTKYKAIKLSDIISKAEPVANPSQLYLAGLDGFTPAIKAAEIEDCYISFTHQNGWEAVNLKHPVSSNTKMLTEIVVVSDGSSGDFALNVIDTENNLVRVTPGQLLSRPLTRYFYPEGRAAVQNNGKDYESQVYTKRLVFKLSDVTPVKEGDNLLVMTEKGKYRMVDNSGYFEVRDNNISYLQPEDRTILEQVRGVILRPPAASIMDTYYDARHYLEGGDRLLVLVLDGLNYNQYSYAAANGYMPFLKRYGTAVKASGVYPPASNVGLAALLTGQAPEENGIVSEKDRQLKASSIFAEANRLSKKVLFLEAAPNRLDTEIQPLPVTDRNSDGNTDDDLYETALANLDKGYDLIMVRFHDIDETGQRYGEIARPTMQAISSLDNYLSKIISKWSGKVIITANQGSMSGKLVGAEAIFSNNNMFVPYWRIP